MLITICDVPEHFATEIADVGGEVVRHWNGLMDVQFKEHKMYVRDSYVKLRNRNHVALILADNEFGNIYVQ